MPDSACWPNLYAMPPEFDAQVADIRLSMDTVGMPTTDARSMAVAMHKHRADSNCSEASQRALTLSMSVLCVSRSRFKKPIGSTPSLDGECAPSRRDVQLRPSLASRARIHGPRSHVGGGNILHTLVMGPKYTFHEEVYESQVRTMASEFERLGYIASRRSETTDRLASLARRRTRLASAIRWAKATSPLHARVAAMAQQEQMAERGTTSFLHSGRVVGFLVQSCLCVENVAGSCMSPGR